MDIDREPGTRDDGMIVRTLQAGDLQRLVAIDGQHSGRNRRVFYEGKLERALQDSSVRISLGAELDGILIGALMGSVHYGEFGVAEPVAILDTILVDQGFAGRGIARDMLDQLLKNLSGLRIERIRTEIGWEEGDLMAFLRKSGFAPVPRLVLERSTQG